MATKPILSKARKDGLDPLRALPANPSPAAATATPGTRKSARLADRPKKPLLPDHGGSSKSPSSKSSSGAEYEPSDSDDVGFEGEGVAKVVEAFAREIGPVTARQSPRLANRRRKLLDVGFEDEGMAKVDEASATEIGPVTARQSPRLANRRRKLILADSPSDSDEDVVARALESSPEMVARAVEASPNFKDELVAYICNYGLKISQTYRDLTQEDDRGPVYACMAKAMRLCEAEGSLSEAPFTDAMKELKEVFGPVEQLWEQNSKR